MDEHSKFILICQFLFSYNVIACDALLPVAK